MTALLERVETARHVEPAAGLDFGFGVWGQGSGRLCSVEFKIEG